jgi:hypothetical protein
MASESDACEIACEPEKRSAFPISMHNRRNALQKAGQEIEPAESDRYGLPY